MEEIIKLVQQAKEGNEYAMVELLNQFEPLLLKEASRFGHLDPDCLQELKEAFIKHVHKYEVRNN